MRRSITRHEIGDPQRWRAECDPPMQRPGWWSEPPKATDATRLLREALRQAQLASLFGDTAEAAAQAIERGAAAAAAAVLLQRGFAAGEPITVEVDWRGVWGEGTWRALPVGETGVTRVDWLHGFSLAALARDASGLGVLTAASSLDACGEPEQVIDPFWAPLCETLAAVWRGDAAATAEAAEAAAQAMDGARIMERARIDLTLRPLLALARAVVRSDQAGFNAALAQCLEQHRRYWGLPEFRQEPSGFVALPAAALTALALTRGLVLELASDYLPGATASFARPRGAPALAVRFAARGILRPDEARWSLDLAGYPRAARSHRIIERDGALVAHYEVAPSGTTPAASADFVMLEASAPRPSSVSLALDAGQLMWLAEVFASGEPSRASLVEAIDCVTAALARFPAGSERLTANFFWTPLGRMQWEAEPGRFTRSRLGAYRNALQAALGARSDTPGLGAGVALPATPTPEETALAAYGSAMTSIGLIKEIVTPVLEALRGPEAESVVLSLRPQAGDYERLFTDPAAEEAARAAFEGLWARAPAIFEPPGGDQSVLRVFVAPAGMLATDNELSRHFPGGYRGIAQWLNPHRVWVCWKYTRPNETSGLAYDGLAWCDDHWAWLPKPYRALAKLAAGSG